MFVFVVGRKSHQDPEFARLGLFAPLAIPDGASGDKALRHAMFLHPIQNHAIRLLRGLPEKPMRLSLEDFHFGAWNTFLQNFRLRHMISSHSVGFADQY